MDRYLFRASVLGGRSDGGLRRHVADRQLEAVAVKGWPFRSSGGSVPYWIQWIASLILGLAIFIPLGLIKLALVAADWFLLGVIWVALNVREHATQPPIKALTSIGDWCRDRQRPE